MTNDENVRFAANAEESVLPKRPALTKGGLGSDRENLINLQAANEYQTSTEYLAPTSETGVSHEEHETFSDRDLEMELFLHDTHSHEFENMMYESLQELEANFESYAHQHGIAGELESIVQHPNYDNVVGEYFEKSVSPAASQMQAELESFSNYVQSNVPIGTEYDTLKRVVDSYQPAQFEDFIGWAKRKLKGAVKMGLKAVKGIASTAINIGKNIVTGPLKSLALRAMKWLGQNIRKVLRFFLNRALMGLPA